MSKWRNALLGGGCALVVAGAGMWLGPAALVSGAGTANIAVDPASMNVDNDGNTFTIDINVSDVNNLGAFDFTLSFDNDLLEYTGIADGGFLSSTGRKATCLQPAAGPNGESREQIANQYGALHFGCTTFGLIDSNEGKPGPDGDGVLATLTFRPKALGKADIKFEGMEQGKPYSIGPANDPLDQGYTGMGGVDVCEDGICDPSAIDVTEQNGIVQIIDPNAPEPTANPATPTRVPRSDIPMTQATVDAALGITPRAGRPGAGSASNNGGNPGGTIGGESGPGGRAGVAGSGNAPAGARGPDGAPLAGYGPQESDGPSWPQVAGVVMVIGGAFAAATGVGMRRRMS